MSTRGCVAIRKGDGWRGVYNHWDSYPSGLGREVWHELQGIDLHAFAEDLLSTTDWREYVALGVCEYCGRKGLGQPQSIRGNIEPESTKSDEEVKRNLERTGYADPEAKYHKHTLDNGRTVEETHITSENPDPLFIEWVYVVDPERRTIEILVSRGELKEGEPSVRMPKPVEDGYFDYGNCKYRHVRVAVVDLDGPEPDWGEIEDLRYPEE